MEKKIFNNKHYNTPGHAHELTFSCYLKNKYFLDEAACKIFLKELKRAQEEFDFHIWAYVIMPSHVHILLWPQNLDYSIAKINQACKGRMSKKYALTLRDANKKKYHTFLIKNSQRMLFRFWQRCGGFDRNFWNAKAIFESIKYIESNPVKAGLVKSPREWKWSSAYQYNNEDFYPIINMSSLPVKL